jgi:hypothetical protein
MYFVREGMGILRKFDDYDEAFKRYSDSKKSLDDVELYKVVSSNLCECMHLCPGSFLESIQNAASILSECAENLNNRAYEVHKKPKKK